MQAQAYVDEVESPAWQDELNRLLDESAEEELDMSAFSRTPMRSESLFFTKEELLYAEPEISTKFNSEAYDSAQSQGSCKSDFLLQHGIA